MTNQKKRDPLLIEAANEVRKEKYVKIFKKYKKIIIASVTFVLLFVVMVTSYFSYKKNQEEKYSKILQQSLIQSVGGDIDAAKSSLESIHNDKSTPQNIRALASLKYAGILLDEGKFEDGISIFLKINENGKIDQYIKDLAGLQALKSLVDSDDSVFEKRIIDLSAKLEASSNVLRYFVIEQKAIFEWNKGNYKVANDIFKDLVSNSEVAKSIKKRSSEMNRIYISRFGEDKNLDK